MSTQKRYGVGGFTIHGGNVAIGEFETLSEAEKALAEMPRIFAALESAVIWDNELGEEVDEWRRQ